MGCGMEEQASKRQMLLVSLFPLAGGRSRGRLYVCVQVRMLRGHVHMTSANVVDFSFLSLSQINHFLLFFLWSPPPAPPPNCADITSKCSLPCMEKLGGMFFPIARCAADGSMRSIACFCAYAMSASSGFNPRLWRHRSNDTVVFYHKF